MPTLQHQKKVASLVPRLQLVSPYQAQDAGTPVMLLSKIRDLVEQTYSATVRISETNGLTRSQAVSRLFPSNDAVFELL